MKTKFIDFKVKSQTEKNGDVIIEGWANPATVDRTKELIDSETWMLDNYNKNPIVLFNHGKDPSFGLLPVGKALAVKATPDGLYCKIKVSNSDEPRIKAVRDLTSEGILQTFSVGFDGGEEVKDAEGVTRISGPELLEISIVTLPMNQDATFSLASKDYQAMKQKLAAASVKGMPPLRPDQADWAEQMERQEKPSVDEPSVGKKDQQETDAEDPDAQTTGYKDDQPEGSGEPPDEAAQADHDDSSAGTEGADQEEGPDLAVQAVVIPKDVVASLEDATTWVKDHGWVVDDVNQTDEAFYFVQRDPSAFDPDSFTLVDIGGGVWAQVGHQESKEGSGTPPIDAQAEAKGEVPPTDEKDPDKDPDVSDGSKVEATEKDGAADAGSSGGGPAAGASSQGAGGGDTKPFAQPQGAGPWTGHKKPPKKKPAVVVNHGGDQSSDEGKGKTKAKMEDPNTGDAGNGQPEDTEAADEHQEKAAGTACADCMAECLKKSKAEGKPHDQAVAIAISECKDKCPTQPKKGYDGPVYNEDQLRAFGDGYATAHEQLRAMQAAHAGGGSGGGAKGTTAGKTKAGHMDQSPTSMIPGGGSQDPSGGMDDNPHLLVAKQTNVLLGALINEIQAMSKKLDGLVQAEAREAGEDGGNKPPQTQPPPQAEGAKALDNLRDYVKDLNQRLKKLGA